MRRHSNLARRPRGNVETESFELKGGLNLVDAPLTMPSGMCLAAINYEVLTRDGYRRIDGFERLDGQGKPSEASYWILNYDGGVAAISEGDVVVGATSGAQGKALINQVGTVTSGYLVLTDVTGEPFTDDEDLEVSAVKKAVADGVEQQRGASTAALDATYAQDAIETRRALIKKVGDANGSGPVRGIAVFEGDVYAFRDNSGATAGLMWKATTTGWVQQSLGNRVAFTAGTAEFLEGETLTGGTSGAQATINRVVLQSGTWGSTAAGYLVIGTVTSGPYQAETGTSASGSATLSGAETANALAAGGRYEFRTDNFFGSDETRRLYGVNGVSEAFEWDGSTFTPILTGNTTDTPTHLEIFNFHLMLAFPNGSLQNSDTGTPYVWAGGGASEIGVGQEILGMQHETGDAMVVMARERLFMLYGKNTAASPWDLQVISRESGGIEWSLDRVTSNSRFLDDQGFMSVSAVQAYGDFAAATYSQTIQPLVTAKKESLNATIISKRKTQLRHYFSDGTGIVATFSDRQLSGFTTVEYKDSVGDPIVVECTANGINTDGSEIMLFGDTDGFVYELDKGTSFDGSPIAASLVLAYSHLRSPAYDKQFKKVTIDVEGTQGAEIMYAAKYDYSNANVPAGITNSKTILASLNYWDEVTWNTFNWSTEDVSLLEGDISGVGRNIAMQISSTGTYVQPHTLFSLTYHYIYRRLVR